MIKFGKGINVSYSDVLTTYGFKKSYQQNYTGRDQYYITFLSEFLANKRVSNIYQENYKISESE